MNKIYNFDGYIAIDWSGDKQKYQKGIKVAIIKQKDCQPRLINPSNHEKFWNRTSVVNWIKKITYKKNYLIGIDFAFSYPYFDFNSYYPNLKSSPKSVQKLWELIDKCNNDEFNFYGGNICSIIPYAEYYNSYFKRGIRFQSRRRLTEILAKQICSPSPTFNCVGPGAVGTGSLAGMRVLNLLKRDLNIWPFNNPENCKSTLVEIFPTFYFKSCKIKPEKDFGYSIEKINLGLKLYGAKPISKNIRFYGPDQDEADALISVAAIKFFSKIKRSWMVPVESKKEGWIFGVQPEY